MASKQGKQDKGSKRRKPRKAASKRSRKAAAAAQPQPLARAMPQFVAACTVAGSKAAARKRGAPRFGVAQATTARSMAAALLWQGGLTDEQVLARLHKRFGKTSVLGSKLHLRFVARVRNRCNSGRIAMLGKAQPPVGKVLAGKAGKQAQAA